MKSCQKNMTLWHVQNSVYVAQKILIFADIKQIFANITEKTYLNVNKENLIISNRLHQISKLSTKKLSSAKFLGSGAQI